MKIFSDIVTVQLETTKFVQFDELGRERPSGRGASMKRTMVGAYLSGAGSELRWQRDAVCGGWAAARAGGSSNALQMLLVHGAPAVAVARMRLSPCSGYVP